MQGQVAGQIHFRLFSMQTMTLCHLMVAERSLVLCFFSRYFHLDHSRKVRVIHLTG